jgi:hypothetical protein
MGVRISNSEAVLFDSTTGIAFSPVFADVAAEEFFRWSLTHVDRDLRDLAETDLAAASEPTRLKGRGKWTRSIYTSSDCN